MSVTNRWKLSVLLTAVVCIGFAWPIEVVAARLVQASVSHDGKTILVASTGDDGRVDADGVWDYLKSIKFKPTQHFKDLAIDQTAKRAELKSDAPRGQAGTIVVDVAYGGKAIQRKLTLVRVEPDAQGREWSLDPVEVDKMFSDRLIRRSDAARLNNPKASR